MGMVCHGARMEAYLLLILLFKKLRRETPIIFVINPYRKYGYCHTPWILVNFFKVCGAKDPSLANLLSQSLEKQSNRQQSQLREPFPTYISSLTTRYKIVSLSQSTILTPLSIQRTIPISHACLNDARGPLLKDLPASYNSIFKIQNPWSQSGGYATGHNHPQLLA